MKNRIKSEAPTAVLEQPARAAVQPDDDGSVRVQVGGRVEKKLNNGLKLAAFLSDDQSKDDILEDALRIYFGTADSETFARQQQVMEKINAFKKGKLQLPFDSLLAPLNSNALTTGAQPPKLTIRLKRMGS